MGLSYKHTQYACYIGYITQAIINNLAPLLFLTFRKEYGLDLSRITLLVTINFMVQLAVDLLAAKYVDKIGYRKAVVMAHIFAAVGLVGLGVFPEVFPTPYSGLVTAAVIYAIGGGLIEVIISPIVEACPTDSKAAAMSLLHSFFCWGCVAVISVSTLLFSALGMERWHLVACLWALVPAFNVFYFARVPIAEITDYGESMTISQLLKSKLFWVFALLMVCSGASELAMSQWASAFAEAGLQVSKTAGDLAGPCAFAILMGISRLWYSKNDSRLSVTRAIFLSGLLCIGSYLLASLSASPLLGLIGCALCGLSVGVFWPGTLSLAAKAVKGGGTRMFALLALGGDMGCSLGPALVGLVSASRGDDLHAGLFSAILFPALLLLCLLLSRAASQRAK